VKPFRTENQKEIIGIILREAGNGRFLNQTELHQMLSYGPDVTYGAIRFSVRLLEKQGMLVKQRTGPTVLLIPTTKAYDWFRPLK
jgi:predicted transcriptional regulator